MIDDPNDPHRPTTPLLKRAPDTIEHPDKRRRLDRVQTSPRQDIIGMVNRVGPRTPSANSDYGSDPFEGMTPRGLDAIEEEAVVAGKAAADAKARPRTPTPESDYGPNPFDGLTAARLETLSSRASVSGSAGARVSPVPSSRDSDYGADPFEGMAGVQLDAIAGGQMVDVSQPASYIQDYEFLRPKLKHLQAHIFHTLLPRNGFSLRPQSEGSASVSDRFQAAAETLHCQSRQFEQRIVSAIREMPCGLDRMKSIQKLSSVFGIFSAETQDYLADRADWSLQDSPDFQERIQAQKFFTIIRDHLPFEAQCAHEAFSMWEENKELTRHANEQLLDEWTAEIQENNTLDNDLSRNSFDKIVDRIERSSKEPKQASALTKLEISELRQSAYLLRRMVDQLDSPKSMVDKDAVQPVKRIVRVLGARQEADAGLATSRREPFTQEHRFGVTHDSERDNSHTELRQELRDAYRERSLRAR